MAKHRGLRSIRWAIILSSIISFIKSFGLFLSIHHNQLGGVVLELADIPNEQSRRLFQVRKVLCAIQLAIAVPGMVYFAHFWWHINKTQLRSALVLIAAVSGLSIAAANILMATIATRMLNKMKPETPEDVQEGYRGLARLHMWFSTGVLCATAIDSIIQGVAVAFWAWLFPPRWRVPNRYRPVVQVKKRGNLEGLDAYQMRAHERGMVDGGSMLAQLFTRHEKLRPEGPLRTDTYINLGLKRRHSVELDQSDSVSTASSITGPKFHSATRYWADKGDAGRQIGFVWWSTMAVVGTTIPGLYYRLVRASTKGREISSKELGHSITTVVCAMILAGTMVTHMALIQFKVAPSKTLLWKLTVDRSLSLCSAPAMLVGFLLSAGLLLEPLPTLDNSDIPDVSLTNLNPIICTGLATFFFLCKIGVALYYYFFCEDRRPEGSSVYRGVIAILGSVIIAIEESMSRYAH
ncbi:hypothetical protein QBC40DRAFT_344804 [Triangularia verruculosa]|uniref:Uncharacterized protein n=1 Tax=Triangularia verruculosa TaxID=2587418 RepID=A0AAN6XR64_9PEZI|nr:hypothetical protein QBC40DRAFT_344804 [Triangularia verruculosa]